MCYHLIPNAEWISLVSLPNIYIVLFEKERVCERGRVNERKFNAKRQTNQFLFLNSILVIIIFYRSGRSGHLSLLSTEIYINIRRKLLISGSKPKSQLAILTRKPFPSLNLVLTQSVFKVQKVNITWNLKFDINYQTAEKYKYTS